MKLDIFDEICFQFNMIISSNENYEIDSISNLFFRNQNRICNLMVIKDLNSLYKYHKSLGNMKEIF